MVDPEKYAFSEEDLEHISPPVFKEQPIVEERDDLVADCTARTLLSCVISLEIAAMVYFLQNF